MYDLIKQAHSKIRFNFPYSIEEYSKNMILENYHCHKDFSNVSTTDSPESIENYAIQVKKLGAKCLYSGEHGNQGNQYKVYNLSEQEGLKYIHSSEAYWVKDRHEKDNSNCHIIIVAKNSEGRKDINYALSIANEDGYYYKPRVDIELLLNIPKDNVIITTACVAGWKYEDAEEIWLKLANHFENNFFVELQYHNTEKQKELNKRALKFAKENNLQIICGLDSHYIDAKSDIRRDKLLEYKNIHYDDEEGWYLDYPDTNEVIKRFRNQGVLSDEEIILSIMNTNIFASDEVEQIVLDRNFKIPTIYKDKTYEEKCKIYKSILNNEYKKEKNKSKEKANGIIYEANQVMDSGVVDYFLTSKAIVDKAVNEYGGELTTTSRGSASSFVTNKLLGLTTIDRFNADVPIYAERFLTKERVDAGMMPDIDLNLSSPVPFVQASRDLLGEHSVYPLMAVEKLKEKMAWQIYASVNNVNPQTANNVSKHIDEYNKVLKHTDDDLKDTIDITDFIPKEYIELFNESKEYQGIVSNLKVHACGHIICNFDVRREIGLITATSESTGSKTLCACIEGIYLDEFGYVKEDFLTVDTVSLTNKLFKSIGMNVPTFDELKEMSLNDKPTWDIYAKGITCCVNQCEKDATVKKLMKYKPTNLAELASFVAAIRPGFASLLNVYLNREEYTTGEKDIDELLEDTAHFMIYQESIMKVLSFLGLPMGDTYGVIKAISKKKLKGEKKSNLMNRLKKSWVSHFGNMDNFDNVWKVIEQSSEYAFNSPHGYSVASDSVYTAWFKAHHTSKFYEVAINHYHEKGKKDKIDALIKEALTHFNYKLGDYEYGKDNRKVVIDDETKTIYPNLSSIKTFGDNVSIGLYSIYQKFGYPSTFLELCNNIRSEKQINKTQLEKLIKIDYFNRYGNINTLLSQYHIFELFKFGETKQMSKDKAIENNIDIDLLSKYSKETEKQFGSIDAISFLNELCNTKLNNVSTSIVDKIEYQYEVLGIPKSVDPTASPRLYMATKVEVLKSIVNIELYGVKNGDTQKVKVWRKSYDRDLSYVKDGSIGYLSVKKDNKKEWDGTINEATGKRNYVPVPNEYEFWLKGMELYKE